MNTNEVARIAAVVGEPARTAMLLALLDGRALTANELARAAGVQPPTASRHLAQLIGAGLILVHPQGRHRYHRLASAEVAALLEGIMQLAARGRGPHVTALAAGPKEVALRRARSCYDHVAGRLGVAIADHLLAAGAIGFAAGEGTVVAPMCRRVLAEAGLEVDAAAPARAASLRPFCRPCLDWSERRFHIAGRLGTSLLAQYLERGWLRRRSGTRALDATPAGHLAFSAWLGSEAWAYVLGDAAGSTAAAAPLRAAMATAAE